MPISRLHARSLTARFAAVSTGCALAFAALTAGPALAAPSKVSGRIRGAKGMTLIALAPDGSATRVVLGGKGSFSLRLRRAHDATLQLLRKGGGYFGPVVLARKRRTGYEALAGRSVKLGDIVLARGFARTKKSVAGKSLDRGKSIVLDGKGAPVGALRHGVVAMAAKKPRALLKAAAESGLQPGSDPDRDGVPSALDLDANGNGRLDNFDPSAGSSSDGFFSGLYTDMRTALNMDATPGITRSTIDRVIAGDYAFNLDFYFDEGRFRGAELPTGAHVDCGALTYCRRGDGTAVMGGFADAQGLVPSGKKWADYTPDGSGFPNLVHIPNNGGVWAMAVAPHATTSQMNPGDTYDVVFDTNAGQVHVPTALSAYFVTTPAIATWATGGNAPAPVSYPVTESQPGVSDGNAMLLDDGKLSLSVWRPQRQGVPGAESSAFIDQGHLHYGVVSNNETGTREIGCGGFYSDLSPTLTAHPVTQDIATRLTPLEDTAPDAAPDPSRTIGFTVDLGACLRSQGVDPAGQTFRVTLTAAGEPRRGGMDRAAQMFTVRFP